MFSTALNGLLLVLLTLLPMAAGSVGSGDDPKPKDSDDRLIVTVNDEDIQLDGDDPVVVHVGGAFLGVRLIGITDELRGHYGAPKDAGVLVAEVEAGSPAAKAGIEVGDVLTIVDGNRVTSTGDVSRAIRRKRGGETVDVELVRGRASRKVTVTLEERKERDRTIDLPGPRNRLRRHAWAFRDGEWRNGELAMPQFQLENLEDLPSLRDRLEELEKRVKELEKKLGR